MTDPSIAWVLVYNIGQDRSEWHPVKRGKITDAILTGSFPHNLADEPDEARGLVRRDMYEKMIKA